MTTRSVDWFENVESRIHPWPGLNWLTPMLYVPDCKEAMKFYESAFRFVCIMEQADDSTLIFVRMRYRGNNFTLQKEGSSAGYENHKSPKTMQTVPSMTFYVYVDDVDQAVIQAENFGCKLLTPIQLQFWGDRKAVLEDPYGYIWELATRVQ